MDVIHSGIEGWWQTSFWPNPPRPLSLVTMSVTLMAASCDSIGTCSLDVDAESLADSLADSTQVDTSFNHRTAGSKGVMFSIVFCCCFCPFSFVVLWSSYLHGQLL